MNLVVKNDTANTLSNISERDDVPEDVKTAIKEIGKLTKSPIEYDVWIYRWVAVVLGFIACITVIGGIYITIRMKDPAITIPDGIIALGSAAVGALAGLLAPTPRG